MSSRAVAQRRQRDRNHVQPVVEVLAERPFLHQLAQVGVGRGDDAGVELDRPRLADALDLALLQRPQQLRLQRQRHQADFIDEERAAMRQLEAADACRHGAGERALGVAEQLGLGQRLGNRGGVERDEALVAARAVVVNRAGDELLAGAGLALDQHGAVHRRDQLQGLEDLLHRACSGRRPSRTGSGRAAARGARRSPVAGGAAPCPVLRTRESCAIWNGLIRKSLAPRFMALTASVTPPKPVTMTARISG